MPVDLKQTHIIVSAVIAPTSKAMMMLCSHLQSLQNGCSGEPHRRKEEIQVGLLR